MGRELTPLTESGALTALAVALAVISTAMPILGGFFLLAWPVPIAVLSCRHGLRWALLACLTSGILLTFMISPLGAAGIVLAYGPVGLALGHGFRQGWSAARTFALGVVVGTLGQAACVGLLLALGGISPFALTLAEMHEVVEQTLALQRASGVPEGEIAALREQMGAGTVLPDGPDLCDSGLYLYGESPEAHGHGGANVSRLPGMAPAPGFWLFIRLCHGGHLLGRHPRDSAAVPDFCGR